VVEVPVSPWAALLAGALLGALAGVAHAAWVGAVHRAAHGDWDGAPLLAAAPVAGVAAGLSVGAGLALAARVRRLGLLLACGVLLLTAGLLGLHLARESSSWPLLPTLAGLACLMGQLSVCCSRYEGPSPEQVAALLAACPEKAPYNACAPLARGGEVWRC
jgi:hypothetical protein